MRKFGKRMIGKAAHVLRTFPQIDYLAFIGTIYERHMIAENGVERLSKRTTKSCMVCRKIRMRRCWDKRLPPGRRIIRGLYHPSNKLKGPFLHEMEFCFHRTNSGIEQGHTGFGISKCSYI